jgi:hypothetical protein
MSRLGGDIRVTAGTGGQRARQNPIKLKRETWRPNLSASIFKVTLSI